MSHKYAVGQMVEMLSAPRSSNRPSGVCQVLACLPQERGPLQYRVQSLAEKVQRVVEEDHLRPSDAAPSAERQDTPPAAATIAVARR